VDVVTSRNAPDTHSDWIIKRHACSSLGFHGFPRCFQANLLIVPLCYGRLERKEQKKEGQREELYSCFSQFLSVSKRRKIIKKLQLTPWSTVIAKLIVSQLVKKFSTIYGRQEPATGQCNHGSLDPVHTFTLYFLLSIVMLSSHLQPSSRLFPSDFPTKNLYMHFLSLHAY
jgi:hypothetical protein